MNNHINHNEVSIVVIPQGNSNVLVVFDSTDVAEEYLREICKMNPFCKAYIDKCLVATRADLDEWKKI